MAGSLRITHVVNTDQFAGLERYVIDVSSELAERGHDVVVIGGQPEALQRLLPSTVPWRAGSTAQEAFRALASDGRRDIVHSHITKADFVSTLAAPLTRAKRVSTRHITAPRGYTRVARRLAPTVRSLLHLEIAVSRWTSDQLDRPSDVVLNNGVPVVPDHYDERDRTVLVAQRLAPEKDTATALRAWARSGLADRGWRLAVAGSGDEAGSLQRQADALSVASSVDFLGWLADPSIRFRTSAVLLAPAPTEPCGLTILEAMSYGLPVIAAGSGGNVETIGRHPHAALFAPGDDEAAAQHLVRLADDDAARLAYGDSIRELQRRELTISAHVDRLEQLYQGVLR